jgi:hypothetical protein
MVLEETRSMTATLLRDEDEDDDDDDDDDDSE